jgi:hypothetical protein
MSQSTAAKYGWRSGLEERVAGELTSAAVPFRYEAKEDVIKYSKPERVSRYTPDFAIRTASGKEIIVETKGRFLTADRQKHLLIQKQHPHLDIRFVFSYSRSKIAKGSKTTYAMWCEKNGFQYADKSVPEAWLKE